LWLGAKGKPGIPAAQHFVAGGAKATFCARPSTIASHQRPVFGGLALRLTAGQLSSTVLLKPPRREPLFSSTLHVWLWEWFPGPQGVIPNR
jgi:hypothetical protein